MKTLNPLVPLVVLFTACGVSTAETDPGPGEREDTQSELSSKASPSPASSPCARGEAYCAATNTCYPEACLSCCFVPTACGKGLAYCASTNTCYPEACLSCCRPGQPPAIDPNTDPAVCDESACGPAPTYPTYQCADGSIGGFTGRCLPRDGRCGWEIRTCPSDADGR